LWWVTGFVWFVTDKNELASTPWERLTAFDIVSGVLAVLALVFAVKQYLDAREAKRAAEEAKSAVAALHVEVSSLSGELDDLRQQTSTRAIPRFPDNVPAICKLLDGCTANTTVRIMVDYIGYTLYSDRAKFDRYLSSLKNALSRNVKVHLLVYDHARAKKAIRLQYPTITEERGKERFADFFRHLGTPKAKNEKEFYRALFHVEETLYREITGVEMKLLAEEPPALFWLKDNPHDIIFSFRDEFPGTGFSFESEDSNLATQFEIMFNTHWQRADEHWDYRW
jgi:hypothetical protein